MHPNNWVLEAHKLIWFGTPKTASSSQKKSCALTFGILEPGEDMGGRSSLKLVNSRMTFWKNEAIAKCGPDWISFTVARNPFDRFISLWSERVARKPTGTINKKMPGGLSATDFAKWLCDHPDDKVDHHARSQTALISHGGKILPTHIMRFETLAEDWKKTGEIVKERTGLQLHSLEHLREGRRGAYREYIDAE